MFGRDDAHYYWNYVARTKPEAQALVLRLGLEFPSDSHGFKSDLVYPIRRLIITGEDSPANLALLLGPLWKSKAGAIVRKTRIDVLVCPRPGTPSYAAAIYLDEGSPCWNPRPANADEQADLAKVHEMQEALPHPTQGQAGVSIAPIPIGPDGDRGKTGAKSPRVGEGSQ